MEPMTVQALHRLVHSLRDHHLLSPAQCAELLSGSGGSSDDPRALARDLVGRGWLTPFQANRVAQGKTRELVLGPYVLLDRLGEGGMGQVFKARHPLMDRVVALKVIRADRLGSPEAVQRFHREIKAAAKLSHPNVVVAHDAAQVEGTHFYVMEYVEGADLARLLKDQGRLGVEAACEYIRQAAL